METVRVPLLLILTLISFLLVDLSQAKHGKKLPSAIVTGTVYCDTCYQQDFSETSHFISGASVAVKCRGDKDSKDGFYKEVKTNAQGVFEVDLPTAVSKHAKRIKACSVKLIHSSEPSCAVASSATSSSLHLKGRKEGTHVFSAGVFAYKPVKQPEICNQKPTVTNSMQFSPNKGMSLSLNLSTFPPPATIPTVPTVPTIPTIPTIPTVPTIPTIPTIPLIQPLLPPLPFLPGLPKPPTSEERKNLAFESKPTKHSTGGLSDEKTFLFPPIIPPIFPTPPPTIGGIPLPPNPFQPPALLPPNPLQPPPATGIPGIPPLFPTPTPAPGIIPGIPGIPGIPTIPGIPSVLPSPPPPPPPSLLPPIPGLPPGLIPGIPPASSSKKTSP